MAKSDPRFPYQHLAVLGMEKVKKYIPPSKSSADAPASLPAPEGSSEPIKHNR